VGRCSGGNVEDNDLGKLLKDKQNDFLNRLQEDEIKWHHSPDFREQYDITDVKLLKNIEDFCEELEAQGMDFENNKKGKLAEAGVKEYLLDLISEIDFNVYGKGRGDGGIDFSVNQKDEIKIQVKGHLQNIDPYYEKFTYKKNDIDKCRILVAVIFLNKKNTVPRKVPELTKPILAGFFMKADLELYYKQKPQMINEKSGELIIPLSDMYYCGGLKGLIQLIIDGVDAPLMRVIGKDCVTPGCPHN
jgi:hypothetical protein